MLNTNIGKERKGRTAGKAKLKKPEKSPTKRRAVYETLSEEERTILRARTIGHGNMAKCEDAAGLPRNTIMRAMGGDRILPVNAFKIRLFLSGELVTPQKVEGFLTANSQPAEK